MKPPTFLPSLQKAINRHLEVVLVPANVHPEPIHEAMRYAVLSGGKRIRPAVTILCAEIFDVKISEVIDVGAAVELIHSSSLILDDLPAMDNSGLRRGVETTHLAFSEDIAVLSSIALLVRAYEIIGEYALNKDLPETTVARMVSLISRTVGSKGLVGGQIDDLQTSAADLTFDMLQSIHDRKTGRLFSASAQLGVMVGDGDRGAIEAVTGFTEKLGLAYQIIDDILDVEGVASRTGKEGNKDRNRVSLVNFVDISSARETASRLYKESIDHLERFGSRAEKLRLLAKYLLSRDA